LKVRSGLRKKKLISQKPKKKLTDLGLDEKLQPIILWTEWPTGAVIRAGSLWALLGHYLTLKKQGQRNAIMRLKKNKKVEKK
jgi:hypothetical protein